MSLISELARDYLHRSTNCQVVAGLVSPVHDKYGKEVSTHTQCNIEQIKYKSYPQLFNFVIEYCGYIFNQFYFSIGCFYLDTHILIQIFIAIAIMFLFQNHFSTTILC